MDADEDAVETSVLVRNGNSNHEDEETAQNIDAGAGDVEVNTAIATVTGASNADAKETGTGVVNDASNEDGNKDADVKINNVDSNDKQEATSTQVDYPAATLTSSSPSDPTASSSANQ